jgi:hypothetical protein
MPESANGSERAYVADNRALTLPPSAQDDEVRQNKRMRRRIT